MTPARHLTLSAAPGARGRLRASGIAPNAAIALIALIAPKGGH